MNSSFGNSRIYIYHHEYFWEVLVDSSRDRLIDELSIPFAAFHKEPVDHDTLLLCWVYLKVKFEFVYRNFMSSGVVLQHSCEKRLREIKPRHPKHFWSAKLNPVFEHFYSLVQVCQVVAQILKRRVRFLLPKIWDHIVQ